MVDTRRYENASNNESATNPEADKWANMDVKGWNTPQAEEGPDEDAQEESAGNLSEDAQETEDNHEQELTPSEMFEQTLYDLYANLENIGEDELEERTDKYVGLVNKKVGNGEELTMLELSNAMAYILFRDSKDLSERGEYPLDYHAVLGDSDIRDTYLAPFAEATLPLWGDEEAQPVKVGDLITLGETMENANVGKLADILDYSYVEKFVKTRAENLNSGLDEKTASEQSLDQVLVDYLNDENEGKVKRRIGLMPSDYKIGKTEALDRLFTRCESQEEGSEDLLAFLDKQVLDNQHDDYIWSHSERFVGKMADYISGSIDVLQDADATPEAKKAAQDSIDKFMLKYRDVVKANADVEDAAKREQVDELLFAAGGCLRWTSNRFFDEEFLNESAFRDGFVKSFERTGGLDAGNLEKTDYVAIEYLASFGLRERSQQDVRRWIVDVMEQSCEDPLETFTDQAKTDFCCAKVLEQIAASSDESSEVDKRYMQVLKEKAGENEYGWLGDLTHELIHACVDSGNEELLADGMDLFGQKKSSLEFSQLLCKKAIEQISASEQENGDAADLYLKTLNEVRQSERARGAILSDLGEDSKDLMVACLKSGREDYIISCASIFAKGGSVLSEFLSQENANGTLTKERLGMLYKIRQSEGIDVSQLRLSRRAIAESGDVDYMMQSRNDFKRSDFKLLFDTLAQRSEDKGPLLDALRQYYGDDLSDDSLLQRYKALEQTTLEDVRKKELRTGFGDSYGLMDYADAVLKSKKDEKHDTFLGAAFQWRYESEFENIEPLLSPEEKTRIQEVMEMTERDKGLTERFDRMRESSSTELRRFAEHALRQAIEATEMDPTNTTTAEKYLDDIQHFFENPNMPTYQKLARAAIYFDLSTGGENIAESGTPVLRKASRHEQASIISTDLLRAAMRSGNRGLKEFLIAANEGERRLSTGGDAMSELSSGDPRRKMLDLPGYMQAEATLATGHDLSRPIDILKEMEKVRSERDAHNREQVIEDPNNKGHFILKEFSAEDYVKGGSILYLDTQFQNGFVSPEMLGGFSTQDMTHWDADTASGSNELIMMQNERGSGVTITELMNNTSATTATDIVAVFRKDERFAETGEEDNQYKPGVYEMYKRPGSGYENFRGCRTGFGAMDVDAFAVKEDYGYNLPRLSFEIVKNGCYIPIVDRTTGEVLFTPEDFDREREKFSGLAEYGTLSFVNGDVKSDMADFHFSDKLDIPASLTEGLKSDISFDALVSGFEDKKAETARVHEVLKADIVKKVLESDLFNDDFKQRFVAMGASLSNSEPGTINMFSTGSTGRDANVPHDGDYDLMFTMDERDIKDNMPKLIGLLSEQYGALTVDDGIRQGKLDVELPDGSTQEIDIDISFSKKIDRMHASTDMVLAQRYDAMVGDPDKQKKVVANVIIAKALMKQAGCYKKVQSDGSDPTKGGIGGIGVENWVLQNHGSLYEAAKSFVEASDKAGYGTSDSQETAFTKFKQHYAIFDIGQNFHNISHKSSFNGYPHDNMITSSSRHGPNFLVGGWEAMYGVCQKVIAAYENQSAES